MAHVKSGRKSLSAASQQELAPTDERRQQGAIERLDRPIADETGRSARSYRAVDTLATMERRGSITAGMRQAAEDFRVRFLTAQLDPLRALDYSRPRDGRTGRAKDGGERGCGSKPPVSMSGGRSSRSAVRTRPAVHVYGMSSAGSAR